MENRNGQGIFLGVVSVATLIVAIIGATFAFFSAQVTANESGDNITGGTNGDLASAMDLMVKKVTWTGTTAASNNLVPADFNAAETAFDPTQLGTTEIGRALTAKCENDGYTGCHVWRITATTSQTVAHANILLDLSVDNAVSDKTPWSYAIFTATEAMDQTDNTKTSSLSSPALATVPQGSSAVGTFGTTALNDLDIHNNAALNAPQTAGNPSVTYYLLVYLNNVNAAQNKTGTGTTDATGTYTGSVTMQAAGGEVMASFASNG